MRDKAIRRTTSLAVVFLGAWASVTDATEPAPADLLQQKVAELDRLQAEIAELREATGTPQTIYVNVEVLEVSLTKMRERGVDIPNPGEFIFAGSMGRLRRGQGAYTASGEASAAEEPQDDSIAGFIDALKQNNIARVLANPCVMMVSGETASFFSGAEIPLPRAAGDEEIEFQEAGTRLEVSAESLGGGRVRLHIRPRISVHGGEPTVDVDGVTVHSLRVHEFDLSCETSFSETVALCGLVTERTEAIVQDGNRVIEKPNEIALWIVVRAEDGATAAPRTTARVEKRPPAPHDSRRR